MVIRYFTLYKKLRNCNMSPWEAVVAINDIRQMSPALQKELWQWCDGKTPSITINGVSYNDLVRKVEDGGEEMNPIRALLMLDWIEKEPVEAMHYLSVHRFHAPKTPNTKEELAFLDKRIAELREKMPDKKIVADRSNSDEECRDGEDIIVEDK